MADVVEISKQYVIDRINDLNQSPDVKEWIYLQRVLKSQKKEEDEKPEEPNKE